MSLKAALSAFLNPPATADDPATDKRNEIKNQIFMNGRTIILAAFAALILWNATKQLITGENLKLIGELVKIYLIIEGIVHLVTVLGNMVIKAMELKAFMLDGKLDDTEATVLKATAADEPKKMEATATVTTK